MPWYLLSDTLTSCTIILKSNCCVGTGSFLFLLIWKKRNRTLKIKQIWGVLVRKCNIRWLFCSLSDYSSEGKLLCGNSTFPFNFNLIMEGRQQKYNLDGVYLKMQMPLRWCVSFWNEMLFGNWKFSFLSNLNLEGKSKNTTN